MMNRKGIGSTAILFVLFLPAQLTAAPAHMILGPPDDEAEILFYPTQAEQGPDGNLYVLDAGDAHIKVFSPAGTFLRKFGGDGQGPGEFQRIDGATFGFTRTGELFFTEYFGGHRWITIMDLEGRLIRVLPLEIQEFFGVEKAASLPGDNFLVQLSFNPEARPEKNYYLYSFPGAIALVDGQGHLQESLLRVEHTRAISYSPTGGDTVLPFAPSLVWTLAGEEGLIWTEGLQSSLNRLDLRTRKTRLIPTPLPEPTRVPDEAFRGWVDQRRQLMRERNPLWWNRFGRVVEELSHAVNEVIPVIGGIDRTPAGHLLVHGSGGTEEPAYGYWLLDAEGGLLSYHAASAWKVHFSGDCLFAVSQDDEGAEMQHVISGFASETEALALLSDLLDTP